MKKKISVTISEETIIQLMDFLRKTHYPSKSEAIEAALTSLVESR